MMVKAGGDRKEVGGGGANLLTHMLSLIGWSIKPGEGEKGFRLITNLNEDSRIVMDDTFIKTAVRSIFGEGKKERDGGANSCLICLPLNHSQIYYDEESQAVVIDAGEAFMSLHRL